jgi:hypothetical protein
VATVLSNYYAVAKHAYLATACKQLHAFPMGYCQWLTEKLVLMGTQREVEQRVERLKSLNCILTWHIREKNPYKNPKRSKVVAAEPPPSARIRLIKVLL